MGSLFKWLKISKFGQRQCRKTFLSPPKITIKGKGNEKLVPEIGGHLTSACQSAKSWSVFFGGIWYLFLTDDRRLKVVARYRRILHNARRVWECRFRMMQCRRLPRFSAQFRHFALLSPPVTSKCSSTPSDSANCNYTFIIYVYPNPEAIPKPKSAAKSHQAHETQSPRTAQHWQIEKNLKNKYQVRALLCFLCGGVDGEGGLGQQTRLLGSV